MRRHLVQIAVLTGLLLLGMVPVTLAQKSGSPPESLGVVATVTRFDARHALATVQTDTSEVFTVPKDRHWRVGDQLACDRVNLAPPQGPQLVDCQPWQ